MNSTVWRLARVLFCNVLKSAGPVFRKLSGLAMWGMLLRAGPGVLFIDSAVVGEVGMARRQFATFSLCRNCGARRSKKNTKRAQKVESASVFGVPILLPHLVPIWAGFGVHSGGQV